jgi:hypothetical protein
LVLVFSEKAAPTLLFIASTKRRENSDQANFVAAFQTPATLFGSEFVVFGLSHILRLSVVLRFDWRNPANSFIEPYGMDLCLKQMAE